MPCTLIGPRPAVVGVSQGACAAIAALSTCGLDGREFTFFGFVPRTGRQRKVKLAQVAAERRACVLYEAPHRIVATLRCARNGPAPERPHA
eukprot:3695069-Prymnesium_polylepis.1